MPNKILRFKFPRIFNQTDLDEIKSLTQEVARRSAAIKERLQQSKNIVWINLNPVNN